LSRLGAFKIAEIVPVSVIRNYEVIHSVLLGPNPTTLSPAAK
jgi:hypothetical protein